MAPPGRRAIPFSAKAKKKQLQSKREEKRDAEGRPEGEIPDKSTKIKKRV